MLHNILVTTKLLISRTIYFDVWLYLVISFIRTKFNRRTYRLIRKNG